MTPFWVKISPSNKIPSWDSPAGTGRKPELGLLF